VERKASYCLGRHEGGSGYNSNPDVIKYEGEVGGADHDNEIFLGNIQIGSTNENGILE
jgi:hypothetical protein